MSAPSASPKPISSGLVVTGYLFAVLIPIIGIVLGITAGKRYMGVGTNHGPAIIGVSVASFCVNFLIIMASSGA